MGNDNNRPKITTDVEEVDKKQIVKSIAFMMRPMLSSSSQAVTSTEAAKNLHIMHHWILIELENQKKYNIESLEDQYKISPVTNELLNQSIEDLKKNMTNYNITLEKFCKESFDGAKKYCGVRNNCIHFAEKIKKKYIPGARWNCGDIISKYFTSVCVSVAVEVIGIFNLCKWGQLKIKATLALLKLAKVGSLVSEYGLLTGKLASLTMAQYGAIIIGGCVLILLGGALVYHVVKK